MLPSSCATPERISAKSSYWPQAALRLSSIRARNCFLPAEARSSAFTAVTKAARPLHFSRNHSGMSSASRSPRSVMAAVAWLRASSVSM